MTGTKTPKIEDYIFDELTHNVEMHKIGLGRIFPPREVKQCQDRFRLVGFFTVFLLG